jgi:hypothetical protein
MSVEKRDGEVVIVIEDIWTVGGSVIEAALPGLLSHEVVEYLVNEIEDVKDYPLLCGLHDLIGTQQTVKNYVGNTDWFGSEKIRKWFRRIHLSVIQILSEWPRLKFIVGGSLASIHKAFKTIA